jgi:hypothetical protein
MVVSIATGAVSKLVVFNLPRATVEILPTLS